MNSKASNGNLTKKLISLVSLDGPKSVCIVLIFVLIFLFFFPTENLSNLPVKSVYSQFVIPTFFNNSCPESGIFKNCGFYSIGQTRGVSSILHGKFDEAWNYNPLSFLLIGVMFVLIIFNLLKIISARKKHLNTR